MAAHGLLSRRVDDLASEMHERATTFIMKLHAIQQRERGEG